MEENAWLVVLILLPVCAAFAPYLFSKWAGRSLIIAVTLEFLLATWLFLSAFSGGFWYRVDELGVLGFRLQWMDFVQYIFCFSVLCGWQRLYFQWTICATIKMCSGITALQC